MYFKNKVFVLQRIPRRLKLEYFLFKRRDEYSNLSAFRNSKRRKGKERKYTAGKTNH